MKEIFLKKQEDKYLVRNSNKDTVKLNACLNLFLLSILKAKNLDKEIVKDFEAIMSYINGSNCSSDYEYMNTNLNNYVKDFLSYNPVPLSNPNSKINYSIISYYDDKEKHQKISEYKYDNNTFKIFDKISIIVEEDLSTMTDNKKNVLTTKKSNKNTLKFANQLEKVNKYIQKEFNNLECEYFISVKEIINKHSAKKIGYTTFNDKLLVELDSFTKDVKKAAESILKKEVNYDDYVLKAWNGNLDNALLLEDSNYYVIAKNYKNEEGFIGLKSIYNSKSYDCYQFSTVKDIRNAILFNDKNLYNLENSFTILDKIYVENQFLKITNPVSNYANLINSTIEKRNILNKLNNSDVPEVKDEEIIAKKKTTKI